MPYAVRRVDYFYATIEDQAGAACELLTQLAALGVNQLAFTAVPFGPERTQLAIFPEDGAKLVEAARRAQLTLDGPHRALLVHGDDELGALARLHTKLHQAQVSVYASTGVTDGRGAFGYLIYVMPDQFERAVQALKV